MESVEMIGGVKRSDKGSAAKRGSRGSVGPSAPLVPYNVFAASAPMPPVPAAPRPAAPAPAIRLDDSESEGDETMARDLPELEDIVQKMGKAATLKKTKVERVLDQLGAKEAEALAAAPRKTRQRKAPEVYKPTAPTAVVRKETKVRAPKKEPGTPRSIGVTPKKEPRATPPRAPTGPVADLEATDELPKCFKELLQSHETYDPKLKNYRYELHKGNTTVIPFAAAYQNNKIAAAQKILNQELKNLDSLKALILTARERAAARGTTVMDLARRAAELRARGPAAATAMEAAAEAEAEVAPRAASQEMSEGGAGARRKSGKKKSAGAAAAVCGSD